ncbi:MAG: GNAT family N-acetyltransferase [Cellulophaga sp.]
MENFVIRDAVLEDLETLLYFEQGIISYERPYDETLDKDPINYYNLRELILDETTKIVVAEIDAKVVGSGFAQVRNGKPYLRHEVYAYLGFMYTDPNYRGKGVNKRIIEELKEWSLAKGIKEIRLTVYSDNDSAIRAYEKVGFAKHLIEMRIPE